MVGSENNLADLNFSINQNIGSIQIHLAAKQLNCGDRSYYDDLSVALSENASTTMQARQVILFGGISATYSRLLKMSASSGIYFLSPNERSAGTISTIQLLSCEMDLDAPDILIDRKVQIGQIILGTDHPSSLNIGRDGKIVIVGRVVRVSWRHEDNAISGRDLIVTPVPVAEKGFGYALSVGPDQTANLGAGDRIILMTPRNPGKGTGDSRDCGAI